MYKRPVPDEVFQEICWGMQEAKQSGELSGLFKGECREPRELPSASKLLHSIRPGIKLYKSFFLKIFDYDITTPGFAEDAISRLEILGSTKARGHYTRIVGEWKNQNEEVLHEVAAWYKKQSLTKERGDIPRQQQEAEQRKNREHQWKEMSKILGFQSMRKEK